MNFNYINNNNNIYNDIYQYIDQYNNNNINNNIEIINNNNIINNYILEFGSMPFNQIINLINQNHLENENQDHNESLIETPIERFTRLNIQVNNVQVQSEEICSVCLQEDNCVNCKTNCSHHFHIDCLSGWISRNNSCPLCRGNITSINTSL
jgi:hypothetical protein